MDDRFERCEPEDPWGWHQPKYEKLVMRGPHRFALTARLPSGESVDRPLGRFTSEMREDLPPQR
jgi:hypothetical protein